MSGKAPDAPEGFRPPARTSPVRELVGPLYARGRGAEQVLGLRIEARVEFQKTGQRLAFGNCYINAGEERIARASAVFLVTGQLEMNSR